MGTLLGTLHARGVGLVHLCMADANTGTRLFYDRLGFHEIEGPPVSPTWGATPGQWEPDRRVAAVDRPSGSNGCTTSGTWAAPALRTAAASERASEVRRRRAAAQGGPT
ncbi:hypothetical protein [Streptomyces peucetius]|uniref:hypothetical protein n=1 Tax=Streptomyces peucetius TaxID=1950 RepID=UPI00299F81C6|nr:hypothetical protein [Streptomyces peucetius]